MPTYRDEAIVLRTHKLAEADRIVTLLTRNHGKVRAVAKGVRRTSSRMGARLEPFMVADVQLYEGRTLDVVNQAETIQPFAKQIAADYGLFTAATAMVEAANTLVDHEKEPALQQYRLLRGGLHALATREHDHGLVVDAYLLRACATEGWAPSLDECAVCGSRNRLVAFHPPTGGVVCDEHRPTGAASPAHQTRALLQALMTGDWAIADASDPQHRREVAGLVAAYTQFHMERRVRSLGMVERA